MRMKKIISRGYTVNINVKEIKFVELISGLPLKFKSMFSKKDDGKIFSVLCFCKIIE